MTNMCDSITSLDYHTIIIEQVAAVGTLAGSWLAKIMLRENPRRTRVQRVIRLMTVTRLPILLFGDITHEYWQIVVL